MNILKMVVSFFVVSLSFFHPLSPINNMQKKRVQGTTVNKLISPNSNPSVTDTPNLVTTITPQKISQYKKYGGWYWQPNLSRSQIYVGTDSAGKDIWADSLPTLTPISTKAPTSNNAGPAIIQNNLDTSTSTSIDSKTIYLKNTIAK